MSDVAQYVIWFVRQFLAGRMDLGLFAQNLGGLYAHAREHPADLEANQLASDLMGPYAQYSSGHVDKVYLDRGLADAIRHLEPNSIPSIRLRAPIESLYVQPVESEFDVYQHRQALVFSLSQSPAIESKTKSALPLRRPPEIASNASQSGSQARQVQVLRQLLLVGP